MPLKMEQYQKSLAQPPLCEQLKVRDLTDDLLIQLNGSFVAGYRLSGIHSYYASDEERNRTKLALEALIRSLPERSMRLQARFEIAEGDGGLIARYNREQQNPNAVLQAVDREQSDAWLKKNSEGYYLQYMLHFYFIWDPRIHHQSPEFEWKKKMRGESFSMSASKCIERSRREHEDLVAEFNSLMSGVEATLQATGMKVDRLTQNDIFLEVINQARGLVGALQGNFNQIQNLMKIPVNSATLPTSQQLEQVLLSRNPNQIAQTSGEIHRTDAAPADGETAATC